MLIPNYDNNLVNNDHSKSKNIFNLWVSSRLQREGFTQQEIMTINNPTTI
jgi:hypothetical protein